MTEEIINIGGRKCHIINIYNESSAVIVKPLGEFERLLLKKECQLIAGISSLQFTMLAFEVEENDLRPELVESTFSYLLQELLPYVDRYYPESPIILGGYSLGGLFALWSATRLKGIEAVFAGSPSLWMEGWDVYANGHPSKAKCIYMSLGNKEECTRMKPFCIIGERVRQQHQLHIEQIGEENCILEWNEGGHFSDIEIRKAKGFAWCLERIRH